ncbi:MAG: hypothetical protein HC831_02895 [Chloroflexia bacterium]|nr:hypothetical protein [Chloroflexia bacterium]
MLKIRAVLLAYAIVSFTTIWAQEGFSDWEKTYFQENATESQKEFVKKVTLPFGIKVPNVRPSIYSMDIRRGWDACLKRSFAAFFTESKSYQYNKTVSLVYGLFNLGNYDVFNYQSALKENFNDTLWVEQTFTLLLPLFKESWYLLDSETRDIYAAILKHSEKYLETFDYEGEKLYCNQLIVLSKPDQFIAKSINCSAANEFRKAEAFIFRRMRDTEDQKGNWTVNWAKKMLNRIKRSLVIS